MRITTEQSNLLKSFKCERLSANAENEELIKSFNSKRGSSLVSYFQKFGLREDEKGTTTYYVIKNQEKDVLMFFSLKCGALFDPLLDENEVKRDFQRLLTLLQAIENANGDIDGMDEAFAILTKYQVGDRVSIGDLNHFLHRKVLKKQNFLKILILTKKMKLFD